jgi:hypothetical protein
MFVFSKGCPSIFASRIRIVGYSIFNVKHCRERKKERFFVSKFSGSCQLALVTTANLHFKKAKQHYKCLAKNVSCRKIVPFATIPIPKPTQQTKVSEIFFLMLLQNKQGILNLCQNNSKHLTACFQCHLINRLIFNQRGNEH